MKKTNNNGFTAIEVILIVVAVGLVFGVGWYVWKQRSEKSQQSSVELSKGQIEKKPEAETEPTPVNTGVIEPAVPIEEKVEEKKKEEKKKEELTGTYISTINPEQMLNIQAFQPIETTEENVDGQKTKVAVLPAKAVGAQWNPGLLSTDALSKELAEKYLDKEVKGCAYVKAEGKDGKVNVLAHRHTSVTSALSFEVNNSDYNIVCTPYTKITALPTSGYYGPTSFYLNAYNPSQTPLHIAWLKLVVK